MKNSHANAETQDTQETCIVVMKDNGACEECDECGLHLSNQPPTLTLCNVANGTHRPQVVGC